MVSTSKSIAMVSCCGLLKEPWECILMLNYTISSEEMHLTL